MADAKNERRRRSLRSATITESTVYDGGRRLGDIVGAGETFVATLATGLKIGAFESGRAAMVAICAADRAARRETELEPETVENLHAR